MPFNATAAPSSALTLEVAGLRANVTTWSVGSIWVTPEQVIDGARRARHARGPRLVEAL